MYPGGELSRLAQAKTALHRDIAERRRQCAAAAGQVARPLAIIDRGVSFWRRISPALKLAAVPLAVAFHRPLRRQRRRLTALVRWGSLLLGFARAFGGSRF